MRFVSNMYLNDGTELILFWGKGTHVVKAYDGAKDEDGQVVCTGSFEKCSGFMDKQWVKVAQEVMA